jgi:uncharacterized protein (TIGR02328 family)
MRLWAIELVENGCLPKSQLLALWRELNSIFKKQDNHILINYIYNYDKAYLKAYADKVIAEMKRRGYKIKSFENYDNYFEGIKCWGGEKFNEHNNEYLTICYWNLVEKYIRGQKDFDKATFERLHKVYMNLWL